VKSVARNSKLKSVLHASGNGKELSPAGKRIYTELTLLLVCVWFFCTCVYLKCHTSDCTTAGNLIHVGEVDYLNEACKSVPVNNVPRLGKSVVVAVFKRRQEETKGRRLFIKVTDNTTT
jgi:hypothetical protein